MYYLSSESDELFTIHMQFGLSIISEHVPQNSSEVKICHHVILACSHGHV